MLTSISIKRSGQELVSDVADVVEIGDLEAAVSKIIAAARRLEPELWNFEIQVRAAESAR